MVNIPTLLKERELLKSELQALKTCQMQYFVLTITATGILLGIADKLGRRSVSEFAYFAPLFVILPCWTVFFDKAVTISRIVGYQRILELLQTDDDSYKYLGWETALREFRKREREEQNSCWGDWWNMLSHLPRAFVLLVDFRRQHRYWTVNWMTFFGLGVCSLVLGAVYGAGTSPIRWVLFTGIFVAATLHNADVLYSLIVGKLSYDEREKKWCEVLKRENSSDFTAANSGNTTSS